MIVTKTRQVAKPPANDHKLIEQVIASISNFDWRLVWKRVDYSGYGAKWDDVAFELGSISSRWSLYFRDLQRFLWFMLTCLKPNKLLGTTIANTIWT